MSTNTSLNTVGNFVGLLKQMSQHSQLQAHAQTLMGPRTRGSTTEVGLSAIEPSTLVGDVTYKVCGLIRQPGCTYYMFIDPKIGGKLGAVDLKTAEKAGLPIKERIGAHGPELFFDVKPEAALMVPNNSVYIIVGPKGEYPEFPEGVIYTWHPGEPLGDLSKGRNEHTAVKLHNG